MLIPAPLRRQVIQRAGNRCEYCGLAQASQEAAFHIDHVVPLTAGGGTIAGNLALACVSCSLRKGAKQTAVDPTTGKQTRLFNPRKDSWRLHFRWKGAEVFGLSPIGRATIHALKLNRQLALAIRQEETLRGRHPSPKHL
jgi:hypothetical protein